MRSLWKGAITFGLVTIPVSLFPATRREELKFRLCAPAIKVRSITSASLKPTGRKCRGIKSLRVTNTTRASL
jgi:non-homologous end joining protein Ku